MLRNFAGWEQEVFWWLEELSFLDFFYAKKGLKL